jgi:hypothetical protein
VGALLALLLIPIIVALALSVPILVWRDAGRKFVLDLITRIISLAKALLPAERAGANSTESLKIDIPALRSDIHAGGSK